MNRIKELREGKGLQQSGLAMKLNTSQSSISAYELGTRSPDVNMLWQMALLFHVSIDYLLGFSEIKKPLGAETISVEDMNLLADFGKLTKHQKEKVQSFICGLLSAN
jgi:transcriptional regulator with XRE-family HTH domain